MISNNSLRNGRFSTVIRPASVPAIADAEPLYSTGDTVMHPSEGICTITELRRMELGSVGMKNYYILKPTTEKSSSTIYMPVARGNTVLRRLLSKEDILSLIHKHNISSSTINRLRHNQPVSTTTLDDLCKILNCQVWDIIEYTCEKENQ